MNVIHKSFSLMFYSKVACIIKEDRSAFLWNIMKRQNYQTWRNLSNVLFFSFLLLDLFVQSTTIFIYLYIKNQKENLGTI